MLNLERNSLDVEACKALGHALEVDQLEVIYNDKRPKMTMLCIGDLCLHGYMY
jgi:hypothetical protein